MQVIYIHVFILQVGVVSENSIPTSFSNYEMNESLPPTCSSNSSGHHSRSSSDENALYEPERSAISTGLSHNSDNGIMQVRNESHVVKVHPWLSAIKACYLP